MPVTKVCPRCGEEFDEEVAFCAKDGTRLVKRGQQTDLIGSVIADRYRIMSAIGEGGMGQVYLAEHVRMKRKSAIKIMRRALVGDVEALQRFTREAENASQIAHPNVAAIFDFGETSDGIVYLAMEYVDGEALAAKLNRDLALHPDVAADILGQAADALQAAHDLGILHRDLKPDNIMLAKRPDGTYLVKLVDFGIARTMDGGDQKVTRTGFAIGTPAYMSPEQLAGDVLDARSDQYSLALVAFMALTGKDAFPAESSKESLIARLTSRPRTLQQAKEDVNWPEELQAIFDRSLSPEPTDRFVTVSDFAHALSMAISAMTPTQTAELYRYALDIRIANASMRTPHSDMQALRTPSTPLAIITPPAARPMVERRSEERAQAEERRGEARAEPAFVASGAYPPIGAHRATAGAGAATSGAVPAFEIGDAGQRDDTGATGIAADASSRLRGVRVPAMVGGVITLGVVAVWLMTRGGGAPAAGSDNTLAVVAGAPIVDSSAVAALRATAPGISAASGSVAGAPVAAANAPPANALAAAALDSANQKIAKDSIRKADKAKADSTRRRAAIVSQFPGAAARAFVGSALDARNTYSIRKDDVRVTIMSPPVTQWRDERARKWKESNMRPDLGVPYDIVDPIEVWSAWREIVRSRRPVYVIEVAPDKLPWPAFEPTKVFDIRHGDIASVSVLRDGVAVTLGSVGLVPAVVNEDAHLKENKKAPPGEIAATLPIDAFAPKADGNLPRIEIVVSDRSRGNSVRLPVSDKLVRLLWDEFKPYRDALAAPLSASPSVSKP